MAEFSMTDKRLFQYLEADRISEALSKAMRQMTVIMLMSDTPIVENMLTTDEVVLNVLVVLRVLVVLSVLNIDESSFIPSEYYYLILAHYKKILHDPGLLQSPGIISHSASYLGQDT